MENTASIVGFIFRKGHFRKAYPAWFPGLAATRWKWFLFLGLAVAGGVAVFLIFRVGIDVAGLPHGTGAITFTDRTGEPLGTVLASDDDHAVWVPLDDVSPAFLSAIVAAEDARFYQHGAVDFASLARAAREYIVYGEARSGGSTITMQLARSLYPTPSTLQGKLAQIVYAERIALRSPRESILEAYVNRIPMGGNLYGIEAAARTYFGIPARQLDLAQASLLAAIPNDPTRLSPYAEHSWHALRTRQRYVLDRMVATSAITSAQRDISEREQLDLLPPGDGLDIAQHFLFWLYPQVTSKENGRNILVCSSGSGSCDEPPEVQTTIDAPLQRFVQAQVAQVVSALAAQHVTDAAALVVDNRTGDVIAYVGSPDYYSDEALGRNDGVQALRQPGSSLKPFTYELALEQGTIRSTSILQDVPTTYAIPGGRLYRPADYSTRFSGPVRVRYALANSLNVPAVRVLSSLGVDTLLDRLHELGFAHLDKPPSYYGLGLTLGSGEVSLWELTHAYLTIARAGDAIPLQTVAATEDDSSTSPGNTIGNPATWMLVTDMLADAHARAKSFGIHSVLELPFPAAVKTGTSSDFRDTWTVGFTRDYTVGVWVGNFDGSPMRDVSGVTGAGPLWNRIMLHLYEQRDPDAFPDPPGYIRLPICATTGLKPNIPGYPPCPAIVTEWILPKDIALWSGTTARIMSKLSTQRDTQRFGIFSPRDGDVFVLTPTDDPVAKRMQRIVLRSIATGTDTRTNAAVIRWSINGKRLVLDPSGDAFWPLQLGTWTIAATNGRNTADVTVRVIPPPHNPHPGFSFR